MELLKNVNGKLLHCGYTTGSCATAGAAAAFEMLLSKEILNSVTITTPAGIKVTTDVLDILFEENHARCAIQKDGGDDPDATHGLLIYTDVELIPLGYEINGGSGVGKVTKPGLDQPIGEYAINTTPRKMIHSIISAIAKKYNYEGGVKITISIPGGAEIAKKTFNPRMGIVDGLSIIGTTGIVEPMSNKALVGTINTEIKQAASLGHRSIILTPGNYGESFAREILCLDMESHVNCSNFIGDAIDSSVELGFNEILLIGHIGKLVKLGMGITNTHSGNGDGRIEELIFCALKAGAPLDVLRELSECVTTDACLDIIEKSNKLDKTVEILKQRISDTLKRRVPENVKIKFICFTRLNNKFVLLTRDDEEE